MKRFATSMLFALVLLACNKIYAQHQVQTIVPQQQVAVGNAFQVQYVATDAAELIAIKSPDFGTNIKMVSGPQIYSGSINKNGKKTQVQNYSYTLLPLHTGKQVIKGVTFVYKDEQVTSSDAYVLVTDAALQAGLQKGFTNVEMYGTNAEVLKSQLLVEATASKKICYVGEPVVATFKLLSRVPSTSEVIKNPGFYGFSVVDVAQGNEPQQTLETRNGNMYTAHLLRKVQLYAAQAGPLVIDEMTVYNTINLIDNESHVLSKAEHELATTPISIKILPLPATDSGSFIGAVGNFSINARLLKDTVLQNATGKLQVTVEGAGNFIQLNAPEVAWPAGIEKAGTSITENLNTATVPVSGKRTYTYSFTTDSTGHFVIPPLSFTYFNPASKKFYKSSTAPLHLLVRPHHTARSFFFNKSGSKRAQRNIGSALLVALLLGAVVFVYIKRGQSKNAQKGFENVGQNFAERIAAIEESSDKKYAQLLQVFQDFLKEKYGITHFTKPAIEADLQQKGFENVGVEKLLFVLNECEVVQYYGAQPSIAFSQLKQQAMELVQKGF